MNETVSFRSSSEFRKWLAANHRQSEGIWLRISRKIREKPPLLMLKRWIRRCALDGSTAKSSASFFESLNKANRYAIAYRLQPAKKPETKRRRMDMILAMLARGEAFH